MSAATGGGVKRWIRNVHNESSGYYMQQWVVRESDHVAALQELQARNADLERRALIAERAIFRECLPDEDLYRELLRISELELIAEGKIQPTEQGGNN